MASPHLPSRRTCLLTCLCAIALVSADFYWRYKIGHINEPVSIQAQPPTNPNESDSANHSVSTVENLPPGIRHSRQLLRDRHQHAQPFSGGGGGSAYLSASYHTDCVTMY